MMVIVIKFLGLILLTTVKFFAVALILLVDKSITPTELFLVLLIGGTLGVLVFYFLGTLVNTLLDKLFLLWKKEAEPKKQFTKKNRWIITLKTKYGLIGIAALSPIFFSIPLGCFLASRFYRKKKTTLFMMLFGILCWSIVFTVVKIILL